MNETLLRVEIGKCLEPDAVLIGHTDQAAEHGCRCTDIVQCIVWITFRLVQRMGGSIHVDSAPGRGSRFEVRLPLAEPGAVEAAE